MSLAPTSIAAAMPAASPAQSGCGCGDSGAAEAPKLSVGVGAAPTQPQAGLNLLGTAPQASTTIPPEYDRLMKIIESRTALLATERTGISAYAGNVAQFNSRSTVAEIEDATTRRLQGLAATVKNSGGLTDGERHQLNTIVQMTLTPGVAVSEAAIVNLVGSIGERTGQLAPGLAKAGARIGALVEVRDGQLRRTMNVIQTGGSAGPASWEDLGAFNAATNDVGTTMARLLKRGREITPQQVQQIDIAAQQASISGDVSGLQQTLLGVEQQLGPAQAA